MKEQSHERNTVCVLLATYNGEAFLKAQLDSLLTQTLAPDLILVSDDGSTDSTTAIVRSYEEAAPARFRLIYNESEFRGPSGNFNNLCDTAKDLAHTYYFFCDQDDYWEPDKIEKSARALRELEVCSGVAKLPALVFTDLSVISHDDAQIAESFARYQGLPNPTAHPLERFVHQNIATGCTMGFNRELLRLASPVPKTAVMHDYWFALCATLFGMTCYINDPLIRYRQHADNSIGAVSAEATQSLLSRSLFKILAAYPKNLYQAMLQAKSLCDRCDQTPPIIRDQVAFDVVRVFSELMSKPLMSRVCVGMRYLSYEGGWFHVSFRILVLALLPLLATYWRIVKK